MVRHASNWFHGLPQKSTPPHRVWTCLPGRCIGPARLPSPIFVRTFVLLRHDPSLCYHFLWIACHNTRYLTLVLHRNFPSEKRFGGAKPFRKSLSSAMRHCRTALDREIPRERMPLPRGSRVGVLATVFTYVAMERGAGGLYLPATSPLWASAGILTGKADMSPPPRVEAYRSQRVWLSVPPPNGNAAASGDAVILVATQ